MAPGQILIRIILLPEGGLRTQPRVSTLGAQCLPWEPTTSDASIEVQEKRDSNTNLSCIEGTCPNPLRLSWYTLSSPPKIDVHFLQSIEVRSQAHAYSTGTLRALECAPLWIGGVEDHVHILCGLSRKISLAELVKNLKTSSTKILKGKGHDGFSWQSGPRVSTLGNLKINGSP